MNTLVVATEKKLMQVLARVISLGPVEQTRSYDKY